MISQRVTWLEWVLNTRGISQSSYLPQFKDGRLGLIGEAFHFAENWIDISATYTEAHPKFRTLARKIRASQNELERVAQEELKGLQGSLEILVRKEERLKQEIAKLNALSLQLNRGQLDFERLQRDRQNMNKRSLVLQRHKEAELEEVDEYQQCFLGERAEADKIAGFSG